MGLLVKRFKLISLQSSLIPRRYEVTMTTVEYYWSYRTVRVVRHVTNCCIHVCIIYDELLCVNLVYKGIDLAIFLSLAQSQERFC